jgi:hypothetical protein
MKQLVLSGQGSFMQVVGLNEKTRVTGQNLVRGLISCRTMKR